MKTTDAELAISSITQSCRITCPQCSDSRAHHSRDKCLSITVNATETFYDCHHCGWAGKITPQPISEYTNEWKEQQKQKITAIPTQLNQDSETIKEFFANRGVVINDMSTMPFMTTGTKYFHGVGKAPAIGFIYGSREEPSAVKWRPLQTKSFTQDGIAKDFFGLERLPKDSKEIIIVEGEADVVALASIGIVALSCPNGAPIKVSGHHKNIEDDKKYAYVWEAREIIEKAERIILATDSDEAGEALTEELARRIDRAKCSRVKFPDGCKDPTDVLQRHSADVLREVIRSAVPMPLVGVYGATEYVSELMELYSKGHGHGESTGIETLDEFYTIMQGQVSIVTGLPSSGKSEFVDQLIVNLARTKGWKVAIASFENPPSIHIAKLCEKLAKKSFYSGDTPRMTKTELNEAVTFINNHFCFLQSKDGSLSTIDSIINRTKQAVMRMGCQGLVIDPYNYIVQDNSISETKQISDMLTKITSFAQAYGIHVWFVAHPTKQQQREDGTYAVVKGQNISGSAAWFAKADVGFTVHRGGHGVEIHVWKVRFKWVGKQGMCLLDYDVPTGRYAAAKPDEWGGNYLSKNENTAKHWQDVDYGELEF